MFIQKALFRVDNNKTQVLYKKCITKDCVVMLFVFNMLQCNMALYDMMTENVFYAHSTHIYICYDEMFSTTTLNMLVLDIN